MKITELWQIKMARAALEMSREELASKIGVSTTSIYLLESGKNRSKKLLDKVIDYLSWNEGIYFSNAGDQTIADGVGVTVMTDDELKAYRLVNPRSLKKTRSVDEPKPESIKSVDDPDDGIRPMSLVQIR